MANNTIQCPVCGESMQSYMSFCPACSFEIHVLPSDIPQALHDMEEQRVRYAKNSLLRMKEENARLIKETEQITDELNNCKGPLEDKISSLERQLGQINDQLARKQEEVGILNQQNQKLKEELETSASGSATANQAGAFLVMMLGESITALYSIIEGENTFGYTGYQERHQQINCDVPIEDNHFVVKMVSSTDSKGRKRSKFFVAPCDGKIYGAANEANIITTEIPLEKNGSFYIMDIKFTLVVSKK